MKIHQTTTKASTEKEIVQVTVPVMAYKALAACKGMVNRDNGKVLERISGRIINGDFSGEITYSCGLGLEGLFTFSFNQIITDNQ